MVSTKYINNFLFPDSPIYVEPPYNWLSDLHNYHDKDYGVILDTPLWIVAEILGLEDSYPEMFYLRHLV